MAFVPNTFSVPFVPEEPPDWPERPPCGPHPRLVLAPTLPAEDRRRRAAAGDLERVAVLGEN